MDHGLVMILRCTALKLAEGHLDSSSLYHATRPTGKTNIIYYLLLLLLLLLWHISNKN